LSLPDICGEDNGVVGCDCEAQTLVVGKVNPIQEFVFLVNNRGKLDVVVKHDSHKILCHSNLVAHVDGECAIFVDGGDFNIIGEDCDLVEIGLCGHIVGFGEIQKLFNKLFIHSDLNLN